MLAFTYYNENIENKGSQMGHTKKIFKKKTTLNNLSLLPYDNRSICLKLK